MDIASISAAYEGLKIGKDLLKSLYDSKVAADAKEKIDEVMSRLGEAQDTLFAMREEMFELQSENDTLRRSVDDRKNWENTLAKYSLVLTAGGAVVFKSLGDPMHYLCPNCINRRQIQILQDTRSFAGTFRCVSCEAVYPVNPKSEPPIPGVIRRK